MLLPMQSFFSWNITAGLCMRKKKVLALNANAHMTFRSARCSTVDWQLQTVSYKYTLSYILSAENEVRVHRVRDTYVISALL